jgi:hypothetical protein
VLRGEAFDGKKADAFSFGVMMWEIVTRSIPWNNWKPLGVYANLVTNGCAAVSRQLVFPVDWPPSYSQLAMECWADNPGRRPSFANIHRQITQMLEEERAVAGIEREKQTRSLLSRDNSRDRERETDMPSTIAR